MRRCLLIGLAATALVMSCGEEDNSGDGDGHAGSPEQAGSACEAAEDCYPDVEHSELGGEVQCLDRVDDGYCTHLCESDEDCCAVEGECDTDLDQVCSPFESTGMNMCFLSCERGDIDASGAADEGEHCQLHVSPDFICRSSGGGSQNRKVCVPGDCGVGEDCTATEDCAPDLDCIDHFDGGHCGLADCAADADCPGDSVCVTVDDTNYCLRPCTAESDCSFCRAADYGGECRDDVDYVDTPSTPVCVPPHG